MEGVGDAFVNIVKSAGRILKLLWVCCSPSFMSPNCAIPLAIYGIAVGGYQAYQGYQLYKQGVEEGDASKILGGVRMISTGATDITIIAVTTYFAVRAPSSSVLAPDGVELSAALKAAGPMSKEEALAALELKPDTTPTAAEADAALEAILKMAKPAARGKPILLNRAQFNAIHALEELEKLGALKLPPVPETIGVPSVFRPISLHVLDQVWCFAAGTPLLTSDGEKPIEQVRVGDLVLARSEHEPQGPVDAKPVLEVFSGVAPILELRVRDRLIRTTAKHPFYVAGKGWVSACRLQPYDVLHSHDNQEVAVKSVSDAHEVVPVYNIRVADYCTYFVGQRDWGFSVWVHNACTPDLVKLHLEAALPKGKKLPDTKPVADALQRISDTINEAIGKGQQVDPKALEPIIQALAKRAGEDLDAATALNIAKQAIAESTQNRGLIYVKENAA